MKRITWFAALMLLLTPVLHAERPQHAKKNQAGTQQQVVSRAGQAEPKSKAARFSITRMKRISDERRWLEWTQKEAAKAATLRKSAPVHRNDTLAQARMLGKRIPYLEAPGSSADSRAQSPSRAATANVLINGNIADTVFLGHHIYLSGSFANGYVSAVLRVYYDADGDGALGAVDPLVSTNILILDDDSYDTDPAAGAFRVSLDNAMYGLVGSYLLSVDDFQSVSTALLVVRQQPASAVVHVTTQPAMPMLVIQVSGGLTFPRLLITDSAGTADILVDKDLNPWLSVYTSDYFGVAGLYIPPTSQSFPVGPDTTPCVLTYSPAPHTIQGF